MRNSVLFWNWWISWRAMIPGQYFWVFFSFPAVKNSFLRALPPTVGWSFFLAGSSPPDIDGPASTAIWANCWVGNDCGDLPTSPSHSTSTILLVISSAPRGVSCTGDGGAPVLGATGLLHVLVPWFGPPSSHVSGLTSSSSHPSCPPPCGVSSSFSPYWNLGERGSQPIRHQNSCTTVLQQPSQTFN